MIHSFHNVKKFHHSLLRIDHGNRQRKTVYSITLPLNELTPKHLIITTELELATQQTYKIDLTDIQGTSAEQFMICRHNVHTFSLAPGFMNALISNGRSIIITLA